MTEKDSVIVTTIMVVRLPNGTVFQVAGDAADIESLKELLMNLPREVRGESRICELDLDSVYMNSDGKEVLRVVMGSAVRIPDVKEILED